MQHFVILIRRIEGVDLILKALRETPCIASHDLADGIEKNLCILNEENALIPVNPDGTTPPIPTEKAQEPSTVKPKPFTVIEGGKT